MGISFSTLGSFKKFGFSGMLQGTWYVFFAYIGFESITPLAKEAKRSSRNIRIATLLTTLIALLLYVGVSTVMVGLVSYKELATGDPLATAM